MEDVYFITKKVNQSSLKLILVHPMMYKNSLERTESRKDSPALSLGSLVDCLITEPEKFKSTYHLQSTINCSAAVQKIVMAVYLSSRENPTATDKLIDYKDLVLAATRQQGYQPKWKDETVITNICNEGEKYFEEIKLQEGKIPVTPEQHMLAREIVDSILTHDFTRPHLFPAGSKIEIIKQLIIDWEHRGFECKSKLDWVVIDHEAKTVQPIDIKTTDSLLSKWVESSYHRYRYDIQAGYYTMALRHYLDECGMHDYTIAPFMFVVENTKYPGTPLTFVINSPELYAYEKYVLNGVTYEGIKEAFDRLEWHTNTNIWEYTKEHLESNGLIGL